MVYIRQMLRETTTTRGITTEFETTTLYTATINATICHTTPTTHTQTVATTTVRVPTTELREGALELLTHSTSEMFATLNRSRKDGRGL